MGYFHDTPERRYLRAGDHIYVYRAGNTYSHHGIFKGTNAAGIQEVIDFVSPEKSSTVEREGCTDCEMMEFAERRSGVKKRCLDCFLNGGTLCRYYYGVSKFFYGLVYASRLRGGTSNTAESGPAMIVLERAENLLHNNNQFDDYHVIYNNCEDFATYCKTGQDCSRNGLAGGQFGQTSFFGAILRKPRRH